MKIKVKTIVNCLFMIPAISSSAMANEHPIAGTTPWQRPAGAPTIEWVKHNRAWYEKALTGVNTPYPRSLYFLDSQGSWYTPFTRPGMIGPYDLRRWHHR